MRPVPSTLFHLTTLAALRKIMRTNRLHTGAFRAVSFTEDPGLFGHDFQHGNDFGSLTVRIVVDGAKLSRDYPVEPHLDGQGERFLHEKEWRVPGKSVEGLKEYVKCVEVLSRRPHDAEDDYWKGQGFRWNPRKKVDVRKGTLEDVIKLGDEMGFKVVVKDNPDGRVCESLVRSLIREMAGPFDNYAFSDERQALPNPPPPESNNFLESAALEKILSVINEEEKLDRKTSDLLNGMLRDGLYRDFLRSPDSEVVFRGMSVYPNELRKLGIDQTPRPGEKIEVKGNFLFEPQGGLSSSWTTNRRIASQFSRFKPTTGEKSSYKIEILMTAMVQKNPYSFLSLSPFYPLMFSYGYEEEDEVMGLGEIMFEKAELKRIT